MPLSVMINPGTCIVLLGLVSLLTAKRTSAVVIFDEALLKQKNKNTVSSPRKLLVFHAPVAPLIDMLPVP